MLYSSGKDKMSLSCDNWILLSQSSHASTNSMDVMDGQRKQSAWARHFWKTKPIYHWLLQKLIMGPLCLSNKEITE